MRAQITFDLPMNMTIDDLQPDNMAVTHPVYGGRNITAQGRALQWLKDEATEEELPIILLTAVAIHHAGQGEWHIGHCLESAIVCMRG